MRLTANSQYEYVRPIAFDLPDGDEVRAADELGYAKAEWHSPVGIIKSAWAYANDKPCFDMAVPVPASVQLPNGENYEVKAGEHRYEIVL